MRGEARSDTPDDGGRSCERKTSLSDPGSLRERRATSPASGRGSGAGDVGARVAVAARAWLGTPYRHQASVKGVGADCLGLVRGLWREVAGAEPEGVPPYSPDWAEAGGRELLREALERWLRPVPPAVMRPGDVLLFRMSPGVAAKHCAVLSGAEGPEPRMIHAYWGRAVVESWMGIWWRRRLVAAFRFPG